MGFGNEEFGSLILMGLWISLWRGGGGGGSCLF